LLYNISKNFSGLLAGRLVQICGLPPIRSKKDASRPVLACFGVFFLFRKAALLPPFLPALAEQDCKGKNFYFPGNILWKII
jgi:hypothetical protein